MQFPPTLPNPCHRMSHGQSKNFTDQVLCGLFVFCVSLMIAPTGAMGTGGSGHDLPRVPVSDMVVTAEPWIQLPSTSGPGPGAARLSMLKPVPGALGDIWVNDLRGQLYRVLGTEIHTYMNLGQEISAFVAGPGLGTGFQSFAIHPEFLENGKFYTTHNEAGDSPGSRDFTVPDGSDPMLVGVVTEWIADNPAATTFSGTSREILRIEFVRQLHGLQEIAFNPHSLPGDDDYGLLYICVGDAGAYEIEKPEFLQTITSLYGTILRIDPAGNNSTNGQYGIPATNPWAGESDTAIWREIYALGFRNPHRLAFQSRRDDGSRGRIFLTNIGEENIEDVREINPGNNYGWPLREGTFRKIPDDISRRQEVFPLPQDDEDYGFTYPVAQYARDRDGDGNHRMRAIGSGIFYEGSRIPYLRDTFVINDIPGGHLMFFPLSEINEEAPIIPQRMMLREGGADVTALTNFPEMYTVNRTTQRRVDMRMGTDNEGEIYLLVKEDGRVYRLGVDSLHPWKNFPINSQGWADTGEWLGPVHVGYSPWVWFQRLGSWAYWPILRDPIDESGGSWIFVPTP